MVSLAKRRAIFAIVNNSTVADVVEDADARLWSLRANNVLHLNRSRPIRRVAVNLRWHFTSVIGALISHLD